MDDELDARARARYQPAIKPVDNKAQINMSKALSRFTREDPAFRTYVDQESGETIVCGMGELHLEVYIERMKREYGAEVETGAPQVAYRETIGRAVEYDYTHEANRWFRSIRACPRYDRANEESDFEFESKNCGWCDREGVYSIGREGIPLTDGEGNLIGFPVVNIRFTLTDGNMHPVDSSDVAFQEAARGAFRMRDRAKPVILEPVMAVSVEGPTEFQGGIVRTLMQRRGMVTGTTEEDGFTRVDADVPLAEMFAYSNVLRSATQGKAEFTMEFNKYARVPNEIAEELREKYKKS